MRPPSWARGSGLIFVNPPAWAPEDGVTCQCRVASRPRLGGGARGARPCASPCTRTMMPLHSLIEPGSERPATTSRARAGSQHCGRRGLSDLCEGARAQSSTVAQVLRTLEVSSSAVPAHPTQHAQRFWRLLLLVEMCLTPPPDSHPLRNAALAPAATANSALPRLIASHTTPRRPP